MIKKLRIKLIAVSMVSLFTVLFIIAGTINLMNYIGVVKDADSILTVLAENNGVFPKSENPPGGKFSPDHDLRSPELPYESRYFSVLLDSSGSVISVDTGKIAAVDTSSAIEYAEKAMAKSGSNGFIGNYRYTKQVSETETRVIFLDCFRGISTFRSFLLTSIGVSFFGMLAVFILMVLLSEKIVKPISDSYEKQKQFITDAGHEIKTPLTIIDADAEILEMDYGENEWLKDIKSQVKRLTSLTEDLTLLSRMEEEKGLSEMIDFPLSDVVSETAQPFQAPAKTQNKTFSAEIEPMLSFCGNEKAIRQLVSILLDNALKYSPDGGNISISLKKQNKSISLKVYNTAQNVDTKNLDRLFDRFYRGDKSRSSETRGYGIGLSVAKAIVTSHKGKIAASSKDGNSLTITVTLPA